MLILLEHNGIILDYEQDAIVNFGLGIADGSYDQRYIVNWIELHKV